MWTDLDRTPVILFPLALEMTDEVIDLTDDVEELLDCTPTVPIPLVRKTTVSWDPPPLRQLLESAPPPPRLPARSQLELDCALSGAAFTGSLDWSPATTVVPPPEVPWQGDPVSKKTKGWSVAPWIAMGAAYAFGMTSIVALEGRGVVDPVLAWAGDAAAFEAPALSKSTPASGRLETPGTRVVKPLSIVGFITDPDDAPKAIDLAQLRVTVAAAADRASSKCPAAQSGTTRVEVTFAPSGHTTEARLEGGPFDGEPAGACITNIMRDVSISPFSGGPAAVKTSVTIHEKR